MASKKSTKNSFDNSFEHEKYHKKSRFSKLEKDKVKN